MEDWIELFEIQDYRHTQDKSLQEDTRSTVDEFGRAKFTLPPLLL